MVDVVAAERGRFHLAQQRVHFGERQLPPGAHAAVTRHGGADVFQLVVERGAGAVFGNLVGEEQSGHIREVGIELYQQMLEEAVAQLKNVKRETWNVKGETNATCHVSPATYHDDWSPTINLGLSVLIPDTYIDDLSLRLGL